VRRIYTALAFLLPFTSNADLLLNGDFTDNGTYGQLPTTNITHWTTWGASGWYQNDIDSDASIKFWYYDTGAFQNHDAAENQVLQYSVQARTPSGDQLAGMEGYLKAEFFDSGDSKIGEYVVDTFTPSDPADTWVQLSGLATAPVATAYGRIVLGLQDDATPGDESGSLYFDNASVEQMIPEPITAGLLLVGAAAAATGHRRRRGCSTLR